MKKYVKITVAVIVGLYCWRNTGLPSYIGTLWTQTKREAEAQVSTAFKIDRIQYLIDCADADVSNMIRLFAEHKVSVDRLKREIEATEKRRDALKPKLMSLTDKVEGNVKLIEYDGVEYGTEQARLKLVMEFDIYKQLEAQIRSQNEFLQAEQSSLRATEEQLNSLVAKQGEYKIRLARLKANDKNLQVTRSASPAPRDNSRLAQIDAEFDAVERELDVQREVIVQEKKKGLSNNVAGAVPQRQQPATDTASIRRHLNETPPPLATAAKVGKN